MRMINASKLVLGASLLTAAFVASAGGCGGGSSSSSGSSAPVTFGPNGFVIHNNTAGGTGNDFGYSVVMSGTQIVVTGSSFNGTDDDMAIWRYNANGALDTTFDSDGVVTHTGAAGGTGTDCGYSVAIDANGKIVVAGTSRGAFTQDLALWRYNADGTLDTTFSGDGIAVSGSPAGGNGEDYAYSVVISGTQIVVAGTSTGSGGNYDMVILLYNANGTLDATFGTSGVVKHNNAAGGNGNDYGYSVVMSGTQMVVAGYSDSGIDYDMTIWRYNANGALDTAFDSDGVVTHTGAAGGTGNDFGYSVVIDANAKIVVAGYSDNIAGDYDMTIWRYNADGSLDTTFDSDGIVTHNNAAGGDGWDSGQSVVIDANGKIVVAGYSDNIAGDTDMAIWRYNANGSIDTTLDSDGIVTHHNAAGGAGWDRGQSAVIDANGKIVVAGYSDSVAGYTDMVIWRYNTNGALNR